MLKNVRELTAAEMGSWVAEISYQRAKDVSRLDAVTDPNDRDGLYDSILYAEEMLDEMHLERMRRKSNRYAAKGN